MSSGKATTWKIGAATRRLWRRPHRRHGDRRPADPDAVRLSDWRRSDGAAARFGQVSTGVDSGPGAGAPAAPPTDEAGKFVRAVLGSTEDVWNALFKQSGSNYAEPRLILFSDAVQSACGMASAAVGPFYCPPDQQVYIDLGFFRELDQRFGAPGDFAQAYVVAHEVGHHVQNADWNCRTRRRGPPPRQRSGRQRLVGASGAAGRLLRRRVGTLRRRLEDRDQARSRATSRKASPRPPRDWRRSPAAPVAGQVSPETWTHGSSDQRVRWLRRGLESGRVADCDTFRAGS